MTKKRFATYQYVRDYMEQYHMAPSMREICDATGIKSPSTVHRHLHQLQEEGKLKMTPGKNRSIVLPDQTTENQKPDEIPVLKSFQPNLFLSNNIKTFIHFKTDPTQRLFAFSLLSDAPELFCQKNDIIIAAYTLQNAKSGIAVLVGENGTFTIDFDTPDNTEKIGNVVAVLRRYDIPA